MPILKNFYFFFLIFLFVIACRNGDGRLNISKVASSITGKVISITDGDTYDILLDGDKTIRIRMEGIDAPEKGMPYYQVAKKYLGNLCFEKSICSNAGPIPCTLIVFSFEISDAFLIPAVYNESFLDAPKDGIE